MQEQLGHSIAHAPAMPWIPDCDTTIKVLYGKQDGAVAATTRTSQGGTAMPSHTSGLGALYRRANTGLRIQAELRTNCLGDGVTEKNRIKA